MTKLENGHTEKERWKFCFIVIGIGMSIIILGLVLLPNPWKVFSIAPLAVVGTSISYLVMYRKENPWK